MRKCVKEKAVTSCGVRKYKERAPFFCRDCLDGLRDSGYTKVSGMAATKGASA